MLRKIQDAIDRPRLEELLTAAVEQYSPSFAEEPAMRVFAARLTETGIRYLRQPVPAPDSPTTEQRSNLIIELGPEPIALLWVGHVDTVPRSSDDEGAIQREGDLLHGLGTADMKSGCAAIIEALVAVVRSGVRLRRGLCVALVVGEEEYGDGAAALQEYAASPVTVIGEPTGLAVCLEHHGYYECRLLVQGMRAHAALPEMGANAIHAMLGWMQEILTAGRELPFAEKLVINPREIRGGEGVFTVAERCEAELDIHVPPGIGRDTVESLLNEAGSRAAATHPSCGLRHETVYWAPGYTINPHDSRLRLLRRACRYADAGWTVRPFRSHSDAPLFFGQGSLPVICGPGRLEVAHTRHEHVSLDQVAAAARLYAAMIHELCIQPET